jgi:hypothetical protein
MRIKIGGRIDTRGIITYFGAIILLSGGARALLDGWASSLAEVLVLAT